MERPTTKQRRVNRRESERQRAEAARRRQRRTRLFWVGGVAVVVIAVAAIAVFANQAGQANAAPTVDGIQCVATEGNVTHTHQHLAIYDKGKPVPVPQGIGISDGKGCLFALHTHSPDGIVHVESPTQAQNTLGQFFDIWGQPLSRTQVTSLVDAHGIRAYVNGHLYTGDPRAITLMPHALITLETGPPWVAATTHFSWPQGT